MAQAVLFACTMNAVRSPMAEAILCHLTRDIHIESVGVRAGGMDPLAVEAMDEIGLAIAKHQPRRFEDLEDGSFDLVITLSPEAQHKAMELTRTAATTVEYWPTMDPTAVEGSREQRLSAYRAVRDGLMERLKQRFLDPAAADT
ncbi:MAG: low molecular weight phosphatase family protein [Alphaproteobacteria bacterium]|nr:low molecular weight phosphatase family protein [Alphaproteobacteria bacterium]